MSAKLSDFDPSLRDGGNLVRECVLNVEMRVDGGAAGVERLVVKLIGYENSLTLELLSESDVFFHYVFQVRNEDFEAIQLAQRLTVNFDDFPALVSDLCAQCEGDSQIHCALELNDQRARLDFVSDAHAFKTIDLLSLDLRAADRRDTELLVAFRFNELKSRLTFAEARYNDLARAVQSRYPHIIES